MRCASARKKMNLPKLIISTVEHYGNYENRFETTSLQFLVVLVPSIRDEMNRSGPLISGTRDITIFVDEGEGPTFHKLIKLVSGGELREYLKDIKCDEGFEMLNLALKYRIILPYGDLYGVMRKNCEDMGYALEELSRKIDEVHLDWNS